MADEDHRAADPPEAPGHTVHVAFQRVQAMLGADYLVPIRLQRGYQLLKTGAIGPKSVGEYYARLVVRHFFSPFMRFWQRFPIGGEPGCGAHKTPFEVMPWTASSP
jgi:hypothetical protein